MKSISRTLVVLCLAACGDTVGPDSDRVVEPTEGTLQALWTAGARDLVSPPRAEARSAAGKPLSVLTSDEVPTQPLDGLSLNGVTFSYSGPDAQYNSPSGPGMETFVQCPCIEGSTAGLLTITFDKPSQVVGFGTAVLAASPVADAFWVEVIGPNGKSRGTFSVDTEPAPVFSAARFSYDGNSVKQLRITFNPTTSRFAMDNVTYHQAPR